MELTITIGVGLLVAAGAIYGLIYLATRPKNRGPGEGGIVINPPPDFHG